MSIEVAQSRRTPTCLPPFTARNIEYSLVAALVSFAAPNLPFYLAIIHVDVSFVALAIAFPPLFTDLDAQALRVERFTTMRAGGVALALAGAASIAVLKLDAPGSAAGWVRTVLIGPVLTRSAICIEQYVGPRVHILTQLPRPCSAPPPECFWQAACCRGLRFRCH